MNRVLGGDRISKDGIYVAVITLLWFVIVSIFTVLKYAPDHLSADFLLHSVMSLQNITLYYWGQNRLLNVLPLIASFTQDPALNLTIALSASTTAFYLFLLISARLITKAVGAPSYYFPMLFIALSSLFLISFSGVAIFTVATGHFEYSFPGLLTVSLFYLTWFGRVRWYIWLLSVAVLIAVAIGVNPATVLPIVFIAAAAVFYKKRLSASYLIIVLIAVASFIFWHYVSRLYGGYTYNDFSLLQLPLGLTKIVGNLTNTIKLPEVFIFLAGIYAFKLTLIAVRPENIYSPALVQRYAVSAIFLFSIAWILLFSTNSWVEKNAFHWRYFVYVIFCALLVAGFGLLSLFQSAGRIASSAVTILMALAALASTAARPVSFADYKFVARVNELSPAPHGLYAGDYWLVWPAVFRDRLLGKPSFGLAYRASGNKTNTAQYISGEIEENGQFSVLCLNDTVENCTLQTRYIFESLVIKDTIRRHQRVTELVASNVAEKLVYVGELFAQLPSNTGVLDGYIRRTNGTAGCLFFGPYIPMKSGAYTLSLTGSSEGISHATLDVSSRRGHDTHARFPIRPMVNDAIIAEGTVHIPEGVQELEVRVCLSSSDELSVSGYKLLPVSQ